MKKLIGDKRVFALEIEIIKFKPTPWGKNCLWINNQQIGNFNDENVFSPFIRSMQRIAVEPHELWFEELDGLGCKEMFNKVFPFFHEPHLFYELSDEEQDMYCKYDTFIFNFGENFDSWAITSVFSGKACKFLWLKNPKIDNEILNNIQCFDVPYTDVQEVYRQFCKLIPNKYWPTSIKKLD